nr:nucleic acid-binding, OB-fold protein [Tanacetum cinerariifolium]
MGIGDIPYFESLLKEGSTYRITGFVCIPTSKYQQTLDTETTLKFGRFTRFESIPAESFPKHYFNFVSYNQKFTEKAAMEDKTSQHLQTT